MYDHYTVRLARLVQRLRNADDIARERDRRHAAEERFERRLKAAALLAAAVLLLAVPPFLKPAAALMFTIDDHKIGWDDNGGNGGFRVCAWYGCISFTPAPPTEPRPYVPPYGRDQS